jgi:two-component system sensor histidine kinase DesK
MVASIGGFARRRKCLGSGLDRDWDHGWNVPRSTWKESRLPVRSAPEMNRAERWGRWIALAALSVMWPVANVYLVGAVRGVPALIFGAAAAAYFAIYIWYCFAGYRSHGIAAPIAVVASLTLLGVALDHLSGQLATDYYLIPLLVAGFGFAPRRAVIAICVVGGVSLLELVLLSRVGIVGVVIQLFLSVPILALFGGSTMVLRRLLETVDHLNAARAEIAQHAAGQERTRIARDLHDLLGHSLSLITLKGELATRLLPEGSAGTDEVRDIVHLSRDALQQVREAVSGYRQPTLAKELAAARIALQAAGIDLVVEQSVGALDRETEAVLGWLIRESTTNVIRHSGARHCLIGLNRTDGQLHLIVTNDGWRVAQAPAGNGLRGLEERLALLGGTLEATALPEAGFRLQAMIPVQHQPDPAAIDVELST